MNVALHTGQLNGIAVCAGNGGLELGLKLALGERYKTVCYIEREAYNARTLVARMDDAILDNAPIWDDIKTFDGKPWRGKVDIISAGFPCQPHSQAGLQKGTKDERWIWDAIERTLCEISPGIIFLENVPNLAFSGLDKVIGSLSKAGYHSVWDTFSAEETGASQKRERLFILSYAHGFFDRREQTERETWRNLVSSSRWQNFSELVGTFSFGCQNNTGWAESFLGIGEKKSENERTKIEKSVGNVEKFACIGQREARKNGNLTSGEFSQPSEALAISAGIERRASGKKKNKERSTNAIVGISDFLFPPFRDDYLGWSDYLARRPDLEPAIRRGSDGTANRLDKLRTIGNGVVPLVAAYAFVSLMRTALQVR